MIEKDELTNARSHVAVAIGTRDLPHSVAERKNTHFGKMGGSGIQPTLSCRLSKVFTQKHGAGDPPRRTLASDVPRRVTTS